MEFLLLNHTSVCYDKPTGTVQLTRLVNNRLHKATFPAETAAAVFIFIEAYGSLSDDEFAKIATVTSKVAENGIEAV